MALFAAWRSRARSPLRPAAIILCLWVAVDVAMTVTARFPAVFAARVVYAVTFAALPGVTAALLPRRPGVVWRALPIALGLAYGAALVAVRHHPLVEPRWTLALQAPRGVVFALALWVFLRQRRLRSGDPGEGMGVLMGWGDGIAVVWGMWAPWWHDQLASALCWLGVAVLVALAR